MPEPTDIAITAGSDCIGIVFDGQNVGQNLSEQALIAQAFETAKAVARRIQQAIDASQLDMPDLEAQLAALHVRCARAETRVERLVVALRDCKHVIAPLVTAEAMRAYAKADAAIAAIAASEVPA